MSNKIMLLLLVYLLRLLCTGINFIKKITYYKLMTDMYKRS